MRIGIDFLELDPSYSGGVATFAIGITKGLARSVKTSDTVIVLVSTKNEAYLKSVFEGLPVILKKIHVWSGRRYFLTLLYYLSWLTKNFKIPYWFDKYFHSNASKEIDSSVDVLVVPTTILGFFALKVPSILCIHDIQHEYYPDFFPIRQRLSRWTSYRLSCWVATSIQVSSHFVKNCILEKFSFVKADNIFIAYEGVDFQKFNLNGETERPPSIEDIKNNNFLFYPAQLWPHKNHMLLIEALAIFRDDNGFEFPCVLTGQDYGHWKALLCRINELHLKKVFYLGRVSFNQLLWLYQNCKAVLALGLHESSSLPVREGATFGKQLICSNIPPNIEAQEFLSLTLVDCHDPSTLAKELYRSISRTNEAMEKELKNIHRVRIFDWDVIAKEYLSVIDRFR